VLLLVLLSRFALVELVQENEVFLLQLSVLGAGSQGVPKLVDILNVGIPLAEGTLEEPLRFSEFEEARVANEVLGGAHEHRIELLGIHFKIADFAFVIKNHWILLYCPLLLLNEHSVFKIIYAYIWTIKLKLYYL
jgi:hypothetical protein